MIRRPAWFAGAAVIAAATSLIASAARPDGSDDASAFDGGQLFRLKGCVACHAGPDGAADVGAGPSLATASSWAGDRVAGMSAEEYIAQSMRTPSAFIAPTYAGSIGGPGAGQMPLLQLSDAEIDAIVTYLLASPDGTE